MVFITLLSGLLKTMSINQWSKPEVDRAEGSWGKIVHPYSKDMFDFAIADCNNWLDLGCGFGRFLNYLINSKAKDDLNYIGYDSSHDMIERIKLNFPDFAHRVFQHDITKPIVNNQQSIVCSAVFIHLSMKEQDMVLSNILATNPLKVSFDINSPEESTVQKQPYFETRIKGAEGAFRMTWQSHYVMTAKILDKFSGYKLTTKFYVVNKTSKKVLYLLEKVGVA
jgi:SAM-dependent methyltransferase